MQIQHSGVAAFVGPATSARAEARGSSSNGATPRDARTLQLLENMLDGMAALYWSPTFMPDSASTPSRDAREPGSRSSRSETRERVSTARNDAAAQRNAAGKQAAQPFHELIAEARRAQAAQAAPTPEAPTATTDGEAAPASPVPAKPAQAPPAPAASVATETQAPDAATTKPTMGASAKPASSDNAAASQTTSPHATAPAFAPGVPIPPAPINATVATNPPQPAAGATTTLTATTSANTPSSTVGAASVAKAGLDDEVAASKAPPLADAKSPAETGENDASELRVEKLLRLLQGQLARREGRALVRLDPPELGVMQVELRMERGEIGIVFEAESSVARDLLSTQLDELRQGLEEAGLRVHRLETRLKDEPIGQPPTGQPTLREERSSPRDDADSHRQGSRRATGHAAMSAPGQEAAGASEPRVVAPRRVLSGASDALDVIA